MVLLTFNVMQHINNQRAMKWTAPIASLVVFLAMCVTVFFVSQLKPVSAGAFVFFAGWLLVPYVLMMAALLLSRHKRAVTMHWYVVVVLVSVGGILFLTDVIFWHPDAQGAIAVLLTPILQAIASAVLLPIASWRVRNVRT